MPVRPVLGALPTRVVSIGTLLVALSSGALLVALSSGALLTTLPLDTLVANTLTLSVDTGSTTGAELTVLYFVLWVAVVFGVVTVFLPTESGHWSASGRR